jgi:prepilin-type N-terminal cleavage/methylation domain-containing protein
VTVQALACSGAPEFLVKHKIHTAPRGFTVPEMLAVVAIITIILSILLPSLGRARKIAFIAVCASNQHQIGVAQQNYLVDSRNVFPRLYNWGDLVGQRGNTGYYASSSLNVKARPLDIYLDARQDDMQVHVAQCPSDLGDDLNPGVSNAFKSYGTSYLPQWASDVFRVKYVYGALTNAALPSMTKSQITSPANKLLLADWPWHGNRVVSQKQTHWHSNGYERQFNTLFADIHVTFFTFPVNEIDVSVTGTYYPAPPNPSHTYW